MRKPAHILVFLLTFLAGISCKKLVQDEKKDLLVQAMTDGTWHIETFQESSVAITDEFAGYNFQFFANGTLTGTRDSLVENGTWTSDFENYSISSQFPLSGDPLKKLDGTWRITDAKTDYVVAEMSTDQGKNILHLRKNQ